MSMRAASGFLVISHSPFHEVRDHRGPVTAVFLAGLITCAPPSGRDSCERRDRAAGTAVEDGKAIAREISCAKPPIGTGQRWALISNSRHSFGFRIAGALWARHDRRPVPCETVRHDLNCVEDGKGGAEKPRPRFITRRLTSGALRPCGRLRSVPALSSHKRRSAHLFAA
jgi:hypothetical protein